MDLVAVMAYWPNWYKKELYLILYKLRENQKYKNMCGSLW